MLLLVATNIGLQVQPEHVTIRGGAGTDFEQVFTLVNDDPQPISGQIVVDELSEYLKDSSVLSRDTYAILPQQSMNLQLRGEVPPLGPEIHHLTYNVISSGKRVGSFTVDMPIEGTPKLHPKLSLEAQDKITQEPLSIQATLFNFGNINAYYELGMVIRELDEEMGSLQYPSKVQLLPGDQKTITLLFTDKLDPGEYTVEVNALVNGEETVEATQAFRVLLADQKKTITEGEDLVLELKRYNDIPRIEYEVRSANRELMRDTLFQDLDSLVIPTASLDPGYYEVVLRVIHGAGTDTSRISLKIKKRMLISFQLVAIVIIIGIISLLFGPISLKWGKIVLISWRIGRREKELNALIRRAHRLANENRRAYHSS